MNTFLPMKLFIIFVFFLFAGSRSLSQGSQISVDPSSVVSLRLRIVGESADIGTATGFVLDKNNKHYLVTNRHVVLACARDQSPSNMGGWLCAKKIAIYHNRLGHLGEWFWAVEDLYDQHGNKRWFEHPTLAAAADLVALPLEHSENVQFFPLDMELRKTDISIRPGDSVNIVGFPLGVTAQAGLPIWKTGTVASDFDVNVEGKPVFLLDTTSRAGMSGSPVYAIRSGAVVSSRGDLTVMPPGNGPPPKKFLGIYSAQMQEAEIGVVWKAEAIMALYDSLP